MVFISGKQKSLFFTQSRSILGESLLLWFPLLMECMKEMQARRLLGPGILRDWVHWVEAMLCRFSSFASFPTTLAHLIFLKSASDFTCYLLNLFVCCTVKVAPLVSCSVLWHFLMFWCFLLRYYPKRWVTHGKRALWSARKGLWAVWCVLFLQEGIGSHCGRWSDPEVLLRGASVMESPHKDQRKLPVHQSTAHHGVGAGRHSTLLCSATPEVRLLPSNWMASLVQPSF